MVLDAYYFSEFVASGSQSMLKGVCVQNTRLILRDWRENGGERHTSSQPVFTRYKLL